MFTTYRIDALKTHFGVDVTFVRFLRKLVLSRKTAVKIPIIVFHNSQ